MFEASLIYRLTVLGKFTQINFASKKEEGDGEGKEEEEEEEEEEKGRKERKKGGREVEREFLKFDLFVYFLRFVDTGQ